MMSPKLISIGNHIYDFIGRMRISLLDQLSLDLIMDMSFMVDRHHQFGILIQSKL